MKFIVNISKGTAIEKYINEKGIIAIRKFLLVLDNLGVYVNTRQGKVYLTPNNCEII